uniref:Clc-like protein n=1 Tax=Elaeophora elaphi TaxID=1147741 RepID=A0A158Q800_9BILA
MSVTEESQNKCGQKTALSIFFLLELIACVLGYIALISPSWQCVYLENGRTEHHHGLWLDCKRDYSHDYGRSREYYETLYRLNKQQSPFDQFFLTSLLCVYKFDYYIDSEDLYDHNHDENRLQDDANQHLLLGWKIASLAAIGFAVLTASAALLLSVCAFCHRTLICAAAVLVTVAALLSSVGLLIFYIWANYQDNNIIKEDDGIYQQYFGWALYVQIAGTTMQFLASFAGCAVTSMALKKSSTKLVKIEVVDRDSSTLLDRAVSHPFRRSFSAVYKLDSADLQKWEKDYTNIVHSDNTAKRRPISVPNFKKSPRKIQHSPQESKIVKSTSNLFSSIDQSNLNTVSETFSSTAKIPLPSFPTPKSILKASKQHSTVSNANRRLSDDPNLTYEYLPGDSLGNSRTKEVPLPCRGIPNQRTHSGSSINVYDKVYEHITDTAKSHDHEQANKNEQISDEDVGRSTLINDVLRSCSNATITKLPFASSKWCSSTDMHQNLQVPSNDPLLTQRINQIMVQPSSTTPNLRDFHVEENTSFYFSNGHSPNHVPNDIAINIFDLGTFTGREEKRSSIKSLTFRPKKNESIEAFERIDNSSEYSSLNKRILNRRKISDSTTKTTLSGNNDLQMTHGVLSDPYVCLGDEMDRSVGSSNTLGNNVTLKSNEQRHEAQLCLNLFMNGRIAPLLSGHSSGDNLAETKKSSITTV